MRLAIVLPAIRDTLSAGKVSRVTELSSRSAKGIHRIHLSCLTCSMIQTELFPPSASAGSRPRGNVSEATPPMMGDMPSLIERLATVSSRPRYAFMVLNLIATAAGQGGKAGPYVVENGQSLRLRDWLCDALSPMANRDPKRLALTEQVRVEIAGQGALPDDHDAATRMIGDAVRDRVRASGRCNVSRAVSELVRAGLVRRHYQGWRVDHHNRGARREAVYMLTPAALRALGIT